MQEVIINIKFYICLVKDVQVAMEEAKIIIDIASPKKGIRPLFSPYHVFKVLKLLLTSGSLGRPALMRELNLGEASMKTLLRRLRDFGLVTSQKPFGTKLTEKGIELAEAITNLIYVIESLPADDLCKGCKASAVVVKEGKKRVEDFGGVVAVRDEVVRQGATGALVLVVKNGDLLMPTPNEVTHFKGFMMSEHLKKLRDVKDGDSIIVGLCRDSSSSVDCVNYVTNAVLRILGETDC